MQGQRIAAGKRRRRAEELLRLVDLGDRMDHLPNQLSGGQRQRVAIGRALANEPAIILADEPKGNLDTEAGDDVMEVLTKLNREQGTTIIVVTHDNKVARHTARILTMCVGRIEDDHPVADALTEDLREVARSRLGQLLINGPADTLTRCGLCQDGQLTEEARK